MLAYTHTHKMLLTEVIDEWGPVILESPICAYCLASGAQVIWYVIQMWSLCAEYDSGVCEGCKVKQAGSISLPLMLKTLMLLMVVLWNFKQKCVRGSPKPP